MTISEAFDYEEPCFVISVAARMVGVRTQTLRYYERLGLLEPQRTSGRQRIYSRRDVEQIRRIRGLMEDFGVNLAGVEVVLKLLANMKEAEAEMESLRAENETLRGLLAAAGARDPS